MRCPRVLGALWLTVLVGLPAHPTAAQGGASAVSALLADLESPEFDRAYAAAERLGKHPEQRALVVPALIEAIRKREWRRCAGDVRDAIARSLGELHAREAVTPLLEVVERGKPIDHECVE